MRKYSLQILAAALLIAYALSAHATSLSEKSEPIASCSSEIIQALKSDAQLNPANERRRFIPKNGDPELIDLHEPTPPSLVNNFEPSARVIDRENGVHGGELHIVKKIGATWLSYFAPERDAYQGDPRRFAQIVGSKAGFFFGFRRISKDLMTIPNAIEATGAIRELNRTLQEMNQEPIGIGFYSSYNRKTSELDFLKRFAYEKVFPIASEGTLELHDVSYHLVQAVLPNKLIDHGAKITQRLLEFTEFLKNKAAEQPQLKFVADKKLIETLIQERSRELDTLGNYAHYKGRKYTQVYNREQSIKNFGDKAYFEFAHGGASADQYLRDQIDKLLPSQFTKRDPGTILKRLLDEFNQANPDPASLQKLQFAGPSDRAMGIKRAFFTKTIEPKDQNYQQEVAEILRLIDKKRASIAQAASKYSIP